MRRFQLHRHDVLAYETAWALQRQWVHSMLSHTVEAHAHKAGGHTQATRFSGSNLLLLLEHPSVYTLGRSGQRQDILYTTPVSAEIIAKRDPSTQTTGTPRNAHLARPTIPVIVTDRGGRATYHGPGQLVAYVVCDLRPHALTSVRKHVNRLEETAIQTLSALGIAAQRDPHNPGVWVKSAKIGAVGVKIDRGIAYHGLAINRDPNLRLFEGIIPCGLADRSVTSLAALGITVARAIFEAHFLTAFRDVFNVHWETSCTP